jgi:hypothetical protein
MIDEQRRQRAASIYIHFADKKRGENVFHITAADGHYLPLVAACQCVCHMASGDPQSGAVPGKDERNEVFALTGDASVDRWRTYSVLRHSS